MKIKIAVLCLILTAFLFGCAASEASVTVPQLPLENQKPVTSTQEVPPSQIPTQSNTTVPTEALTVPAEPLTQLPTTSALPLPTTPDATQPITLCGHDYQPAFSQAPTCEQAGFQNYRCQKCGEVHQQLSLPLGHSFSAATCTAAKHCERCGLTEGFPLGHQYEDGLCRRCGDKDPSVRIITIQVKDTKNTPVDGVTVELYIADTLHSSATSSGGLVTFAVKNHTGSYKLVPAHIPEGYKARKDSYLYRSDSGAIVLDIVPVITPEDHSKAAYQVGSTMGPFTITDIDGTTYPLSELLQEKKLVILNFWYCSCIPCKAEFPYFNSIYQRYSDDIELLALNHFDSEAQIRQLRSELGLTFPLATENLGMQQGFGIQSYPVTVFIGSNGRILYIQKDTPFHSEAELDALVKQMIAR